MKKETHKTHALKHRLARGMLPGPEFSPVTRWTMHFHCIPSHGAMSPGNDIVDKLHTGNSVESEDNKKVAHERWLSTEIYSWNPIKRKHLTRALVLSSDGTNFFLNRESNARLKNRGIRGRKRSPIYPTKLIQHTLGKGGTKRPRCRRRRMAHSALPSQCCENVICKITR